MKTYIIIFHTYVSYNKSRISNIATGSTVSIIVLVKAGVFTLIRGKCKRIYKAETSYSIFTKAPLFKIMFTTTNTINVHNNPPFTFSALDYISLLNSVFSSYFLIGFVILRDDGCINFLSSIE